MKLFLAMALVSLTATVSFGAAQTGTLKIEPVGEESATPLRRAFAKRVEVFGIDVFASRSTPDAKVLHAANVLAKYLDNDEDGIPDNPLVLAAMKRHKAGIKMFATQREARRQDRDFGDRNLQDLFADETRPGGASRGEFDATLEEVLHSVTQFGFSKAYPEIFGERPGTAIASAMDKARGGHFRRVPDRYPAGAWYTYDDRSCRYGCQITEYIYWGLTSMLGAQGYAGRAEEIGREWRLNTAAKVKKGDPDLYRLLTDPKYRFPTVLPDGTYRATKLPLGKTAQADTATQKTEPDATELASKHLGGCILLAPAGEVPRDLYQEPYGPAEGAEWKVIRTAEDLKVRLPLSHRLIQQTLPKIMGSPSRSTLDEFAKNRRVAK